MAITTLDLDPAKTPVPVALNRPLGDGLDRNGRLDAPGNWGLTVGASGVTGYFDTAGATAGESAALAWDGAVGRFFLLTEPQAGSSELHMMLGLGGSGTFIPQGVPLSLMAPAGSMVGPPTVSAQQGPAIGQAAMVSGVGPQYGPAIARARW